MKFVAGLVATLFFLYSIPALAVKKVIIDGEPHACFNQEKAEELLKCKLKLPGLEELNDKLEKLVKNKNKQIDSLQDLLDNQKKQTDLWKETSKECFKTLEDKDKWYKSPVFWGVAGTVVGLVVGGALVAYASS